MRMIPEGAPLPSSGELVRKVLPWRNTALGNSRHSIHKIGILLIDTMPMHRSTPISHEIINMNDDRIPGIGFDQGTRELVIDQDHRFLESCSHQPLSRTTQNTHTIRGSQSLRDIERKLPRSCLIRNNKSRLQIQLRVIDQRRGGHNGKCIRNAIETAIVEIRGRRCYDRRYLLPVQAETEAESKG